MRRTVVILAALGVLLLAASAEAWSRHGQSHGHSGGHVRLGLDFIVPVAPYPVYPVPVYAPPPVYQPRCDDQVTPGYWRQVPWYTDSGGYTVFRNEWVPPGTTRACQ